MKFFKNKNILITGVAGFAGSWLAEKICELQPTCQIFGLVRESSSLNNILHIIKRIKILHGDILDTKSVQTAMKKSNPDIIFHLAGQASVKRGFEDPFGTYNANVIGTLNILESTRSSSIDAIIHFAGSSNVYGIVPEKDQPIKEITPTRPVDPYATSKTLAEILCSSYFDLYGMRIVCTRAFHHEGPRCPNYTLGINIYNQIITAKKGRGKKLVFGNVDAIRDLNDVRDVVEGYMLAAERGKTNDIYNLCSGKGTRIQDLIEKIAAYVGFKNFQIISDPELSRPSDIPVLIGDNTKAKKELGWQPKIPFEQTLKDMIEYYSKSK